MAHQRTLIRQAVVAALIAADTSAGARVFASRVVPFKARGEFPVLAVYTLEEETDIDESLSTAPRELDRRMPLVIEGWVVPSAPADNVDELIDDLALEVETAMHADPYFGDTCAESILDRTETEVVEEGNRLVGILVMTYAVRYHTKAPEPPDDLDDFLTVGNTTNLGGVVHEDIDAEDHFVVQEES